MRTLVVLLALVGLLCGCSGSGGSSSGEETSNSIDTDGDITSSQPQTLSYQLNVDLGMAPVDNPLKGFMPYYDQDINFPCSLEWFYVPMSKLMSGPDSFTFATGLEPQLEAIAARGHQAVFRVYLDTPGEDSGVPRYLIDAGVSLTSYSDYGGGLSPDYEDERLVSAMESLIAALGQQYNADPRIGFITVGFLGFWGEWHTYPQANLFASRDIQVRVLSAMANAFPDTRLLLRYPEHKVDGIATGYHDDSFTYATLPNVDWHFLQIMNNAEELNAWQTQPIGGEVYPPSQEQLFADGSLLDSSGNEVSFSDCVAASHVSWLLDYDLFANYSSWDSAQQQRAITAAKELGYMLAIEQVDVSNDGDQVNISCAMTNLGVAPFYYDWPVTVTLSDDSGTEILHHSTNWSLSSVLPDDSPVTFRQQFSTMDLPAGEYQLAIEVVNPLAGGHPLVFANQEQVGENKTVQISVTVPETKTD